MTAHAQIRIRTITPMLLECIPIQSRDGDILHTAVYGVETRGEGDDVGAVEGTVFCADAVRFDSHDWVGRVGDGDGVDVGAVELFVVVLFEGGSFGAEGVGWF